MIRLIFQSYMDKKKYMMMFIYLLIIIFLLIIMCIEKDSDIEMMLHKDYYQVYYEQLFMQIMMILNAMFVLFLAMDHDQSFLKPFYAFFNRKKVVFYKYQFHVFWIMIYSFTLYMLKTIIFKLIIPIDISFDMILLIDLSLDMIIILNLMLIFMRSKYRTLSVVIVLFYILYALFIQSDSQILYYIFPIYSMGKTINLIELCYKVCYIYLGFLIYWLKSSVEDV